MRKIFIICSKAFYGKIEPIERFLKEKGFEIYLPHTYKNPNAENEWYALGEKEHQKMKGLMFKKSRDLIKTMDAVLVLNFEKNGVPNYIGGSTFLEIYEAFMENKDIYLYHDIPNGLLYDEIHGFAPILINENLNLVK